MLGSLQMAGKIRRSFSHDQFEKWSDNMCRSLLMWQSTFLCNQFGNNCTDSEKSPDKVIYMNDIFSMKCNSSYALILSLKVNSFLNPWHWVPLSSQQLWPHSCRGLWSWGLKLLLMKKVLSQLDFKWYRQSKVTMRMCFYLIRTAHPSMDFQTIRLFAIVTKTDLRLSIRMKPSKGRTKASKFKISKDFISSV